MWPCDRLKALLRKLHVADVAVGAKKLLQIDFTDSAMILEKYWAVITSASLLYGLEDMRHRLFCDSGSVQLILAGLLLSQWERPIISL